MHPLVAEREYTRLMRNMSIEYGLLPAEFLLLTQNWRGKADIDPILPRARYVYGDAKAGGSFHEGKTVFS
jgi:hypothetical protein